MKKKTQVNSGKLFRSCDYLVGQLPDHPNHPKGRNPYVMLHYV